MRTTKIGNLLEPFERTQRERRPIPALPDFEITRTGRNIWSVADEDWVDDGYDQTPFPFVKLLSDGVLVDLNRNNVTALAWLTPEQRAQVRERLPAEIEQPWPPAVLELEQELGVGIYGLPIAGVARRARLGIISSM